MSFNYRLNAGNNCKNPRIFNIFSKFKFIIDMVGNNHGCFLPYYNFVGNENFVPYNYFKMNPILASLPSILLLGSMSKILHNKG